jgi:hypothetical protein
MDDQPHKSVAPDLNGLSTDSIRGEVLFSASDGVLGEIWSMMSDTLDHAGVVIAPALTLPGRNADEPFVLFRRED